MLHTASLRSLSYMKRALVAHLPIKVCRTQWDAYRAHTSETADQRNCAGKSGLHIAFHILQNAILLVCVAKCRDMASLLQQKELHVQCQMHILSSEIH